MLITVGKLSGAAIYGATFELYEDQYAPTIEALLPGAAALATAAWVRRLVCLACPFPRKLKPTKPG